MVDYYNLWRLLALECGLGLSYVTELLGYQDFYVHYFFESVLHS